jgi:hypothetical protein
MRSYVGVTFDELSALLEEKTLSVNTFFAATEDFNSEHPELDEEEREFILSMLAAEEALELREAGFGFVVAVEIPDEFITEQGADSITTDGAITLDWVACFFLVSPDGEDLTWYGVQEVGPLLPSWKN